MDFLGNPIWQGIGAIATICALLLYIYVERDRIFPRNLPDAMAHLSFRAGEGVGYWAALLSFVLVPGAIAGVILVVLQLATYNSIPIVAKTSSYFCLLSPIIISLVSYRYFRSMRGTTGCVLSLLFVLVVVAVVVLALSFLPVLNNQLNFVP